jgi:hypothetical protein
MTDDNIDYDKLSTMVVDKLHTGIFASLRGKDALDETWLQMELNKWFVDNATFIARYMFDHYEFDAAFKSKLKSILNANY